MELDSLIVDTICSHFRKIIIENFKVTVSKNKLQIAMEFRKLGKQIVPTCFTSTYLWPKKITSLGCLSLCLVVGCLWYKVCNVMCDLATSYITLLYFFKIHPNMFLLFAIVSWARKSPISYILRNCRMKWRRRKICSHICHQIRLEAENPFYDANKTVSE